MPEAAMHEDGHLATGQYDVRRAGQVAAVQPEAVAGCEQRAPREHFGLRVLAMYAGHHPASHGRVDNVGHSKSFGRFQGALSASQNVCWLSRLKRRKRLAIDRIGSLDLNVGAAISQRQTEPALREDEVVEGGVGMADENLGLASSAARG